MILRLLDRPIAYHRIFAQIGGSVHAGVFLSQSWYWSLRTKDPDGWFWKTREEWFEETYLSRSEQERARKKLVELGILEEDLRGIPAKLHFRIDRERLETLISEEISQLAEKSPTSLRPTKDGRSTNKPAEKSPSSRRKNRQLDGGKIANILYTENSSETTSKITSGEIKKKQTEEEPDRQPIAEHSQSGETIVSPKVEPNPCATIPSDQESVGVVNQDLGLDKSSAAPLFEFEQFSPSRYEHPAARFERKFSKQIPGWRIGHGRLDYDPGFVIFVRDWLRSFSPHPVYDGDAEGWISSRELSLEVKKQNDLLAKFNSYKQQLTTKLENEQRKSEAQHTEIVEDALQIDGNALRAQLETSNNPIKKRILSVLDKLED